MTHQPPLRIVFAGTPEFAAKHLKALINSEHELIAVYTQPDRPAGRGKKLSPSPVKVLALAHEIDVVQPSSLKLAQSCEQLRAFDADIMVVVAYGLLLPPEVLAVPRLGCVNVHGSILPRWRGAAPIQRAIEAGDAGSGVTIMQMDQGLDTGDMLLKVACAIGPTDTSAALYDKLAAIGPPALLKVLAQMAQQVHCPEVQTQANACYAKKIDKSEALIDWSQDAALIGRKIRAFNPYPICYTLLGKERLRIYEAELVTVSGPPGMVLVAAQDQLVVACGEHALALKLVQLPGKKVVSADVFLNGFSHLIDVGTILGSPTQ